MPGLGAFLFRPMALAVAFAMIASYILSRTFVPSRSAMWLKPHDAGHDAPKGPIARAFARWERVIDRGVAVYVRGSTRSWRRPRTTIAVAFAGLALALVTLIPIIRREFFPEVDGGAFEMAVRAPSGTRIEITNERIDAGREARPQADPQARPRADRLRDRRDARLVGRLHPQRRPDGRDRPDPARPSARARPRSTPPSSAELRAKTAVLRPRIRLRHRRPDPRGHERGQIDPGQRSGSPARTWPRPRRSPR